MGRTCCICKSYTGFHKDLTFHTIPKNEETRKKWLAVIKRENLSKSSTVCSDHFTANQIKYQVNKRKGDRQENKVIRLIIPGSVPTYEKQIREDNNIYLLKNKTIKDETITQECESPEVLTDTSNNSLNMYSDAEIPGSVPTYEKQIREDNKIYLLKNKTIKDEPITQECESPEVLTDTSNNSLNMYSDAEIIAPDKVVETPLISNVEKCKNKSPIKSFTLSFTENNGGQVKKLVTQDQADQSKQSNLELMRQTIANIDKLSVIINENQEWRKKFFGMMNDRVYNLFHGKRKLPVDDEIEDKRSKVLTVTNLGDLRPEHFKDPTDYRVVPKFVDKHQKMFNRHRQEKFQLKKKVQNLKELLSELHKKELISKHAADDLKIKKETFSNN